MIMDVLLHEASSASSTHTSPSTPQSPSPYAHAHPMTLISAQGLPPPSIPHNPDQLTRLKILMRETDIPRERKRNQLTCLGAGNKDGNDSKVLIEAEGLGTNRGTTRFLFRPPNNTLLS